MKKLLLLLCLLWYQHSYSQDIIRFPTVATGIIDLGDFAVIQFDVDLQTTCDSYTVNRTVNYVTKTIDITVNYNYNSFCMASISSAFERQQEQILLLGIYSVNLRLNVPSNSIWNRSFSVGSVSVVQRLNNCSDSSPLASSSCPSISILYVLAMV